MKIDNLTKFSTVYTSNVYLVTGTWNTLEDKNTLVDVGRDPCIIDAIMNASTGVGKKRIEQVVLTHSHYDHAGMLAVVRKEFNPRVFAFSPYLEGIDVVLSDGFTLMMGDRSFEVIHAPGHSSDSVCLFSREEGVLFSGDVPLVINSTDGTYSDQFLNVLQRISNLPVRTIYFGHGDPLRDHCSEILHTSLKNALSSRRVER